MGGTHPLWSLLELHSEPGDYVFGTRALDNVMTRLMEQPGKNAPTPASEDTINNLPIKLATHNLMALCKECTVCKDDFVIDDAVTHLPCKHVFHHECIRSWLLLNGTCPICRHSIVV
ncbi:hypothetical protein K493DRAFT_99468 [Basidiobolus meristosporus CBS 931.73]|uniref:RING-type domain-containing protein n=1 Tax=Basidiobolus meristosporus CBS 931.73 TaxID=1314790 RepID=A0A1Y1YS14_9FUNG|nr:hypothetical protein K493DRAFT_99468 [Basidiobolus meristosporus CBS 931.73]|eukprot:ORY00828.1 hypothetical protein K493DRAFT_99468 [Basidiobolus meristosporus CBS 931.73]